MPSRQSVPLPKLRHVLLGLGDHRHLRHVLFGLGDPDSAALSPVGLGRKLRLAIALVDSCFTVSVVLIWVVSLVVFEQLFEQRRCGILMTDDVVKRLDNAFVVVSEPMRVWGS